jgi:recombination protein RecT
MTKDIQKRTPTPVERLKSALSADSVKEQFSNALADNAPMFVASLIDLYGGDKYLQECEPGAVIMEALKAATLKLPINKSLGFAYVIPYKNKGKQEPQFQIGYKGYIQLAMRTGKYRFINAGSVLEGEVKKHDKLSGELELGEPIGDKVVGYFAYLETINGFKKTLYWTSDQMTAHAKRFSKSFSKDYSPWKSDFDSMALKTMLRALLSKYGVMSIEMNTAIQYDSADVKTGFFENDPGDDKAKALTDRIKSTGKGPDSTQGAPEGGPQPTCTTVACDANTEGICQHGFVQGDDECVAYLDQ